MKVYGRVMPFAYLFPSLLLLSNCVNTNYDLSKEIDKAIVVGAGSFVMPIGDTEPITIDEFINREFNFFIEDESLKLSYSEPIDSINWGEDISDNRETVLFQLDATVENTIPLEFRLRANVFDNNGESLADIEVSEEYINRGTLESVSQTDVELVMTVPKGLLKQIYSIDIVIEGEVKSTTSLYEFSVDQYMQLKDMVLRVKGGLDIEL